MATAGRDGTSVTEAAGAYRRADSAFRHWIAGDATTPFAPEAGRYHLYLARACPWSHRVAIVRALEGLEDIISTSWAAPCRDERGWAFPGEPHVDDVNGFQFLREAYQASSPSFDGRPTLPVLWDRRTGTIVNNESGDIIRMLDRCFDDLTKASGPDLYPEALRSEIDHVNTWAYECVQNGVYQCGFALTQQAYDAAFRSLFEALAELDSVLGRRRYLAGDVITEADWRLFPTLVRFDPVYHTHFRCNGRRLTDHPNLWAYARELYQEPGVAATVDLMEIKAHYYTTHDELNPKHIIAGGPLDVDWSAPHGRDRAPTEASRRPIP